MKICFVMPQMQRKPIGGYKIVYEYANRLSRCGHDISILYLNSNALARFKLPPVVRYYAISLFTSVEPRWFKLDKQIKKISSTKKGIKQAVKDIDIAIATGANTVSRMYELFDDSVKKVYFVQGYETWVVDEEELFKTFSLEMDIVVVSRWLKDIVDRFSKKPSLLLSNPIDTNVYRPFVPIKERSRYKVGLLYHTDKNKGFETAFQAVKKAREVFPQIQVKMFGTSKPDLQDCEWIDFTLNATQKETVEIYNDISIFVCGSVIEGFGLTGLEAMACGAALVSTEYEGAKEYAVDGMNALLSPVLDPDELAKNIIRLISDNEKRIDIANNGYNSSRNFSWDNAVETLNEFLSFVDD